MQPLFAWQNSGLTSSAKKKEQILDGSLLTREDLLFLFDSATARMCKERSGLRIALRNVVGCHKETLT